MATLKKSQTTAFHRIWLTLLLANLANHGKELQTQTFDFFFASSRQKQLRGKQSKLLPKNVLSAVTRVLESWPKVGNFFLSFSFDTLLICFRQGFLPEKKARSQTTLVKKTLSENKMCVIVGAIFLHTNL